MTKYYSERHKFEQNNNDIPISLPDYTRTEETKTYYCNYCRRNLTRLDNHPGDVLYFCSFCTIESNPEKDDLRSKGKVTMSEGPITEPATAYAPERTLKRKKTEPRGTFKVLKDRGINIVNYKETGWRKETYD